MVRRLILSFVVALLVATSMLGGPRTASAATPLQVRQTFSFDFAFDFCGPLVQGHDDVSYDVTLWVGATPDATGDPVLERERTHVLVTGTLSANGKTLLHTDNYAYHDPAIAYVGPVTLPDGTTGAGYTTHETYTGLTQLRLPEGRAVYVGAVYFGYDSEVVLADGQAPFFSSFTQPTGDVVSHGRLIDFCQPIQQYLG
jgi:hypothetical protein